MVAYLALIRQVINKLKGLPITQISREENTRVNKLACLASSLEADLRVTRVECLSEPSIMHLEGIEIDLGPS